MCTHVAEAGRRADLCAQLMSGFLSTQRGGRFCGGEDPGPALTPSGVLRVSWGQKQHGQPGVCSQRRKRISPEPRGAAGWEPEPGWVSVQAPELSL